MTFSDFLQMLYPCVGNNDKIPDFVLNIARQIMEDPNTDQDKKLDSEDNYNPLSRLAPNTLYSIYEGKSRLSSKNARVINAHIDKQHFEEYIATFPQETIDQIEQKLRIKEVNIDKDIDRICADIFEEIIKECSQEKPKRKPCTTDHDTASKPISEETQNQTGGAQLSIPPECKICFFCQNWTGGTSRFSQNTDETYGLCNYSNQETLSSQDDDCKKFKPHEGRLTNYLLTKDLKIGFSNISPQKK